MRPRQQATTRFLGAPRARALSPEIRVTAWPTKSSRSVLGVGPLSPAFLDWRHVAIRVAGIGRLVVGVGAVHGPAKGGPATGRNPTAREGAPASPKGLKARSPVHQRAGLPAPTPASAGFGLGQELGG
jgi:hypothetical protein